MSILSVPIASFISFYFITKIIHKIKYLESRINELTTISVTSLLFTIGMDLFSTVDVEKIDIITFSIKLLYLTAWIVIFPVIILGGHRENNSIAKPILIIPFDYIR